jgi:hypothetical protein
MPEFDFMALALVLAAVSLGGMGVILAGTFLFPTWSAQIMKTQLPYVIIGVILIGVSGLIIASLGGTP